MTVAKRFRYLVGILIGVAIIVSGAAISALYTAALSEERETLRELAQSQVRLIEAIARFGTVNSGENNPEAAAAAAAATISQVVDAHKRLRGFGASGEFLFGRAEGDSFVFLQQPRFNDASNEPIPFASGLAEPMRRALYGQAGTMVGPDYRGVTVLAAYEPIPALGAGLVAKIDLAELRAPFIRAGAISLGILVAAVLLGIVLFRALLQPVKEEFEQIIGNFRRAERVAGIGSWRWDAAANVVEWSDEIYRMYRVDRETLEVNYETGIAFIHPEDRSRVEDQMRQALADGKPYRIEHRFLRADGEVRHAEQHCHVAFGVDGNPQRILGTIQDITDRKNAEVELRASDARLNAFFAEAPAGLVMLDPELKYVKVNETLARPHGRTPDDHVGRSIYELAPDVAEVMGPLFLQVLETGEPIINLEYSDGPRRPDGVKTASVTSIFPVLGADGTPHGVGAISTDITEKKKAEAALRESQETLSLFQDSTTEDFALFDRDLILLSANAASLRHLGKPLEQVVGRPLLEFLPHLAGTERYDRYREIVQSGGTYDAEIVVTSDDGETGYRAVSAFRAGNGLGVITRDITEKKQAEAALRASDARLNAFFADAPAGLVMFDRDLRYLKVNDTLARRHGRTPAEHAGKHLREILPYISAELEKTLMEVLETGESVINKEFHDDVPSNPGKVRAWLGSFFPTFGVDGEVDGIGGITTDITEEKRAQQAFRQTEERWNLFTEAATQAFMLFDADFNVIDINEGGARQFRFGTRQNLIGKNMLEMSPSALSSGRLERYREVLRTGNPLHLTGVLLGDTGIVQEIRAFRVGAGLGVMAEDVTERKRAEAALRESEERRRLFMDSAGEAFVLFDSDLNIIDINRAGLDQFDYAREEVIGKNLAALSPDAVSSGRYDRYLQLLKTGETHRAEVTHIVKDGHERIMDLRTFPVGDGMGVISDDITVRKHAERQLESLNHRLEELVTERTAELRATQDDLLNAERLAALGQLTATVAHELRNPLGTIRTSVFNLRSRWDGNSDGIGRPLQRIERNIARCDRIISELLDFSANQEPILETVDLNQCIAAWIDDYEASEGIAIHLAISDGDTKMPVDQDRLHQVIVNLLDNASQAREASPGTLRRDIKIAVRTQVDGHNFILEVADDGPGIPSDILPRIFEPLFSTKGFGVGLGLPLVKKIIDQHGGDIKVVTAVGDGTTFRISLPVAESKEAAA